MVFGCFGGAIMANNNKNAFDSLNGEVKYTLDNGHTFTRKGSEELSDLFSNIAKNINDEVAGTSNKPNYRFFDVDIMSKSSFAGDDAEELREKIRKAGYRVEIIEDIEEKDVTKAQRFFIRITSIVKGVYVDFDLAKYRENIKNFDFSAEHFISEEISRITGSINKKVIETADAIVEYLSFLMYYPELHTLTYSKIGWAEFNRKAVFRYDVVYAKNPLVRGRAKSIQVSKGLEHSATNEEGLAEWIYHTINLLNNHSMVSMLLGAGVSGVVRGLLPFTKETNININISGEPASGKSTIGHYIISMFGNPVYLEGSFTDTDNAMEVLRIQRPVLPYVLDERMLKVEGSSEQQKSQILLMDIFREYEGKVKERLGKQYEDMSGERTYGPIISSSVESMLSLVFSVAKDYGQFRRFMEFKISNNDLFGSPEEAKKTEDIAYHNYGFGIRILVRYLLDLLEYMEGDVDIVENGEVRSCVLKERFDEIDKRVENELKNREKTENISGLTSSSKRFSLILLSYEILRESLLYELYMVPAFKIKMEDAVKKIDVSEKEEFGQQVEAVDSDEEIQGYKEVISALNNKVDWTMDTRNLSFDDFYKRKNGIKSIKYDFDKILKYLINNLVYKMKQAKLRIAPENKIFDYVMKYSNYFHHCKRQSEKWDALEGNYKFIGKWIEGDGSLEIILISNYGIDSLLFSTNIPEPDEILNYIKVQENRLGNDAVKVTEEEVDAAEQLGAVKVDSQYIERYCRIHKIEKKRKAGSCRFSDEKYETAMSYKFNIKEQEEAKSKREKENEAE